MAFVGFAVGVVGEVESEGDVHRIVARLVQHNIPWKGEHLFQISNTVGTWRTVLAWQQRMSWQNYKAFQPEIIAVSPYSVKSLVNFNILLNSAESLYSFPFKGIRVQEYFLFLYKEFDRVLKNSVIQFLFKIIDSFEIYLYPPTPHV